MKRVAAVALVVLFAVGCAARTGSGTGSGHITRQVDDSAQRADHGSVDRPIGQR